LHSAQWESHPNPISRSDCIVKDHLGNNIYAAERKPLPIPWKPNTEADKELEGIKIEKAKAEEATAKARPEETKGEESAVTDEFNSLASLIGH